MASAAVPQLFGTKSFRWGDVDWERGRIRVNSQHIAAKHYLQVTDGRFDRAAETVAKAARNAEQYADESARKGRYKKQQTPVVPEEYGGARCCTNI
jgi:hypothetical protein